MYEGAKCSERKASSRSVLRSHHMRVEVASHACVPKRHDSHMRVEFGCHMLRQVIGLSTDQKANGNQSSVSAKYLQNSGMDTPKQHACANTTEFEVASYDYLQASNHACTMSADPMSTTLPAKPVTLPSTRKNSYTIQDP